jgi:DNA-binding CsgD family transcriptional regulator
MADLAAGRGRSVLVEGEPGIGKSALVSTCLAGVGQSGFEVLRGGCDELGRRFPLSVMVEALGVDVRSADRLRARAAWSLSQPAGEASGRSVPMPVGDPVAAAVERLLGLVDRLCARGPLVLAVDDLQWADEVSLLLFHRLSRATAQLPLVLIGICRPVPRRVELDRLRRDLRSAGGGVLIALAPLGGESVSELAEALAGGRPGVRLAALLESAAGNPLYVREILDALGRTGASASAGGVAELTGPPVRPGSAAGRGESALASLAGVIADRLDFLSADCRRVLRAAALFGARFAVADVARMLGRPAGGLAELLDEALAAEVLEPAGDRLRFRHELIRQALFEATPEALRTAMYRDAAQASIASGAPVERVAELLLRACGDADDGWELDWLADNAGVLVGRAPAVAAELFEQALAHTGEDDPRYRLLEDQLAAVAFLLARYDQAERAARRILAGPADPDSRGQAVWILGYTLLRGARFDEAARLVGAVVEDRRTAPVWRARLTALQAMILSRRACDAEAARAAAWALAEGERLGDPMAMGYALHASSLRSNADRDLTGYLALIDRALAVGGDARLADLRLLLLSNRAMALNGLDRFDESADALRQARALAERTGTPRLATIHVQACAHAFDQGRWDDALAELDAIPELEYQVQMPLLIHGLAALIAGHRDDRRAVTRHLGALSGRPDVPGWASASGYLLMARALAAERDGGPRAAVEVLAVLLTPEYEQGMETRVDWLPALASAAWAAEDGQTARSAHDACRAEADREPLPRKRAAADWCRGLVEADPAPVLSAAGYFRTAGRRADLGNALEDAAVLQARAGAADPARATLTEAMAVYAGLGAVWDADRAVARLRPFGVRLGVRGPRRRPRTGWRALTVTELRVAELVAEGRSNPDIAGVLMLSRRTVQTHVSHILAKLEVHSRREIADLAELVGS